jgi:psiF repeat
MKHFALLGTAALLCAATTFAATPPAGVTASPPSTAQVKPLTAQQERMKGCNADVASQHLKGEERKTYMQNCLSGKPAAAAATTPQERMKNCNSQANTQQLKGDARKTFMSSCLKAD